MALAQEAAVLESVLVEQQLRAEQRLVGAAGGDIGGGSGAGIGFGGVDIMTVLAGAGAVCTGSSGVDSITSGASPVWAGSILSCTG